MRKIPHGFRVLSFGGCAVAITVLGWSTAGSIHVDAQRNPAAAAQQPSGAMPGVTVGGLRIVGPGVGENATELRPFNESPGTTIVLLLAAPAGAGLVAIDNDTSSLKAVTDDKGQSLLEEGRIGPFPKVSNDGSVGLVEVEVRGRPSAGATAVTAQGTIAVTLASGSKPQRIPNVRLEANRVMKVGTATITVKEVTPGSDSTSVTLGLARSVMSTIRDVHFFTAQGAAIESRRTGSGYMNDAGELSFDVKTKDTVATLEFDVWQNPRAVKLPFSVKVGVGMDK
jgi:hypothetical protein